MKIIYTDHASKRMRERNISSSQIEETLILPDYTVRKSHKIEAHKQLEGKKLKVVYIEGDKYIKVITLMWK
jgi:hypothetical protein